MYYVEIMSCSVVKIMCYLKQYVYTHTILTTTLKYQDQSIFFSYVLLD